MNEQVTAIEAKEVIEWYLEHISLAPDYGVKVTRTTEGEYQVFAEYEDEAFPRLGPVGETRFDAIMGYKVAFEEHQAAFEEYLRHTPEYIQDGGDYLKFDEYQAAFERGRKDGD